MDTLRSIVGFVLRAPIAVVLLLWPVAIRLISQGARSPRRAREIVVALLILIASVKVGLYLVAATPLDHIAVQIVCVSRGWIDGVPLFHALDAPVRYSLLYGPVPYVFAGTILWLVPAAWGLAAVKLGFIGCFGLAVAATARVAAFSAKDPGAAAWNAAMVVVALSLALGRLAFTARADALLMLAAAAGLWIAIRSTGDRGQTRAQLLVGALAGLATACKIHGAIYLLPAMAILCARRGRSAAGTLIVASAACALAPFALPGVDLAAHLALLRSATHHGFSAYLLALNASLAIFLWVPAISDADPATRETSARRIGMALALAVASVIGGKTGAGPSHLLPLIPAAAVDWSELRARPSPRDWRGSLALAWAIALAVVLAAGLWFERLELVGAIDRGEAAELRALVGELAPGGAVQLAPTDAPNGTRVVGLAPESVLSGGPYDFDLASLSDLAASGVPLAATARDRLGRCATRSWLTPRGAAPFSARSVYPPHGPLFDDDFRQAFAESYRRTRSTPRFDVWSCDPED